MGVTGRSCNSHGKVRASITLLSVLGCMLFGLSGCTIRLGDFTVISSKNVKIPTAVKGERVTGEDCVPVILLPIGIPNMEEAIDRAIESAGPEYDALVDAVVYSVQQAFIFGQICYKAEGTPINTKTSVSMAPTEIEGLLLHSRAHLPVHSALQE